MIAASRETKVIAGQPLAPQRSLCCWRTGIGKSFGHPARLCRKRARVNPLRFLLAGCERGARFWGNRARL